jgi:hypothetical protein
LLLLGQPDASFCRATNITSGNFTLSGLEPGSTLQLFVTAHCSETDSVNSPTILVSLPEVSNARCGEPPVFDPASLKNPLASLKPGDVVYIGNLTMIVDQATGTNGKFSGTGVITLVFDLLQDRIPSLAAEFTNLYIDSTYNVYYGIDLATGEVVPLGKYDPNTDAGGAVFPKLFWICRNSA